MRAINLISSPTAPPVILPRRHWAPPIIMASFAVCVLTLLSFPAVATAQFCASSPCLNGGTCIDESGGFSCICPPGLTGTVCQTDIDECASSPCLNGGTCINETNGFSCICAPGNTGATCGTDIEECASNPCQNGGTCIEMTNSFSCTCPEGFTGETCADPVSMTIELDQLFAE